jgi:tRNA-dihydrouridine synthase
MVGQVVGRLPTVPVIGAGGIHSLHDARDYLDAGAVAVQVDSVVWMNPRQLEYIARDMTGLTVTRETGALYDEWYEGMSASTLKHLRGSRKQGGPQGDAQGDAQS